MSEKALRHSLEYGLFRILTFLLLSLPEAVALRLGGALGWVAGTLLRIRRADVDANLRRAFPDESPAWRRRVARRSYVHLGRESVAMFRLAGMDRAAVVARTDIENLETLEAALGEGRGVVLVTGHLGNWEIGGAALSARGISVDAVAKGMANRRFGEALVDMRAGLGLHVVDMSVAHRQVPRALGRGAVVALVADQNAGDNGIFVDFFGTPASTHRGPALFALRAGAPLLVGTCVREEGWPQRYRIVIERVDSPASGDLAAAVRALTEAHTSVLERAVRAAPEQYFWQHKRWKTQPPASSGNGQAGGGDR